MKREYWKKTELNACLRAPELPFHDGKSWQTVSVNWTPEENQERDWRKFARRTNTTDICIVKWKRTWTSGDP